MRVEIHNLRDDTLAGIAPVFWGRKRSVQQSMSGEFMHWRVSCFIRIVLAFLPGGRRRGKRKMEEKRSKEDGTREKTKSASLPGLPEQPQIEDRCFVDNPIYCQVSLALR